MRLPVVLLSGLLIGCVSVSAALAESNPAVPTKADRAKIAACVQDASDNGNSPQKCIGLLADPCVGDEANSPTALMEACYDRESTVWDERLNEHYKKLMAALDDDRKAKLKAQQKAWIALREQTCEMEASFWDGGTGGNVASTACFMRETAHRALTLFGFAGYLEQ